MPVIWPGYLETLLQHFHVPTIIRPRSCRSLCLPKTRLPLSDVKSIMKHRIKIQLTPTCVSWKTPGPSFELWPSSDLLEHMDDFWESEHAGFTPYDKMRNFRNVERTCGFFFRILMLRCKLFFYSFKIETCIMKLYRPISMDQWYYRWKSTECHIYVILVMPASLLSFKQFLERCKTHCELAPLIEIYVKIHSVL